MRPAHMARAFGRSAASTVFRTTFAGNGASAHLDRLHHSMGQVRLSVLRIGNEADQTVISCSEVGGEGTTAALVQENDSTDGLRGRWPFHPTFGPQGEVLDVPARRELQ